MKKILLILSIFILFSSGAEAKTLRVLSLKSFSTLNPSPTFSVQTVQRECLSQDLVLEPGTIISGIVLKVEPPKRGKRNSYFEFIPTQTTYKGQSEKIKHSVIVAQVVGYNPVKPTTLAFNVTRKVANFFLKGAISAIEFADGAIEAQDGQRLKSGAMKAYKDSFFSYIEPGKELNIERGDILTLKIKTIR